MKIGIVGLPNVGKSTLFNALTRTYAAAAENFPFCTIEPNVGRVEVADSRLDALSRTVSAKRIVSATVEFVDIAGLVEGASKGEWLGNKFLSHIREVDAILQVVRDFPDADVHHIHGRVDPRHDIEIINTELILADLDLLERKTADYARKARSNDRDAMIRHTLCERLTTHLQAGNIAYTLPLTDDERAVTHEIPLITLKPFIYAINLDESRVSLSESDARILTGITDTTIPVCNICAKLEMDMLGFSAEDRAEYLSAIGITENPTDILIRTCFDAVGLAYYFTAGEIEVRAWAMHKGTKAPAAAGIIHTDFERTFIKAEVVFWQDLVTLGGWAKARESAKVRMEGKDYIVRDGDVIVFRTGA